MIYAIGMVTNKEIIQLLRTIAAVYTVKEENRFRILAYEKAADAIEQLSTELSDMWKTGTLDSVPGLGKTLQQHLDELFRTGKVRHFETVLKGVPSGMFTLLAVPGFGPKRAYELAQKFHLTQQNALTTLTQAATKGEIAQIPGFGIKREQEILENMETFKQGQTKENRILINSADQIARDIQEHLHKCPAVLKSNFLGSLRRRSPTIGDIDVAVVTNDPNGVTKHFLTFPYIAKVIEQGPGGASIRLNNGRQVDMRVCTSGQWGSMLQYFTGSKNHNIKLREYALKKGLSLNEYGIKQVKSQKSKVKSELQEYKTEEKFYEALGLPWIPPEMREDKGEVTAAQHRKLPTLLKLGDIKGDLHIHCNYQFDTSHDLGSDSIEDIVLKAEKLGYDYVGISDHNPSVSNHTEKEIIEVMKERKEYFDKFIYSNTKSRVKILLMMEIDILSDGKIALPDDAFEYIDAAIVSIHSSFTQPRDVQTRRILNGLRHPKVKIFGHPTGRLIGKRESITADWDAIFDFCVKHNKALEINASPYRLDLPDQLVFEARRIGVRFCIDTDSHAVDQMDCMRYGIDVARRGWLEKSSVLNTMGYNEFRKWILKGGE